MARQGDFMKIWIGAAALLVACPAFAAGVATCTLSADKKTVTVTASNPYSQAMACEVNCHMGLPNGFATVVCVKPVPVGSKDLVICTSVVSDGHPYTQVKDTEANCPDPSAPPPAAAASKPDTSEKAVDDDDDDDDKVDQKTQKMMKQKRR
jgi:hypothetical protein